MAFDGGAAVAFAHAGAEGGVGGESGQGGGEGGGVINGDDASALVVPDEAGDPVGGGDDEGEAA